ncbi:hypothetical protein JW916_02330 [Candidatus Sumerlaeota bacterium]|nr:hypothetical protein [Candidatus Sumerlaeota bacterium]
MTAVRQILAACSVLLWTTSVAPAQDVASSAAPSAERSFSDFQLVAQRNIFDSQRVARRANSEPMAPTVRVDRIVVLGTLIDGGERVAFLQGTQGAYSGTFRPGDTIADLVVSGISTEGVRILDGDRAFNLAVGRALERRGEEPWQLGEGGSFVPVPASGSHFAPSAESGSASSSSPSASASPSSDASAGGSSPADDILKRMMERRQREMQK